MIDTLLFLATATGSGYAASLLMTWLRTVEPRPTVEQWHFQSERRWLWSLLYAPRYARLTVFALALVIGALASAGASWLIARDTNLALEAALAVVVSQLAQPQSRLVEVETTH
jgi:hypothetical protein